MMNDLPYPASYDPSDAAARIERLQVLAAALDEKILESKAAQHGWVVSLILEILPPAEPFPSDCLEDVVACVRNTGLQLDQDEAAARKRYRVPDGEVEDFWVFFQSSPSSWKTLGGRAGWLILCSRTLKQRAFFVTAMN
ncbi:MAG: hypothetical protein D4R65_13975 [Verrucomicrobiaceae bacterium]|nr:MAG: hypothetical protein D4R65_13975 [Verrucomicrobiaceae bacterium]